MVGGCVAGIGVVGGCAAGVGVVGGCVCGVGVVLSRVRLDLWRVGGVGTSFHVGAFKPLKNMAGVGKLERLLLTGPLRCTSR